MTTEELLEKAFTGDEDAQIKIVHTLIGNPENELLKGRLKEFADLGWEVAQDYYSHGLAHGGFRVKQNLDELKELAHLGWKSAQWSYCYGLAMGEYGIDQDPEKLKKVADLGWNIAKYFYSHGLANGIFGVEKNPEMAKELRKLWGI